MKAPKIPFLLALTLLTVGTTQAQEIRPGRGDSHHHEHYTPQRPQLALVETGQEARLFLPHHITELPGVRCTYECNTNHIYIARSDRRECVVRGRKPTQATQVICKYKWDEKGPGDKSTTHEDHFVFFVEVLQVNPQNVAIDAYTEVGWDCNYSPTVTLYPDNASCALNWWTDDPAVATVNQYGRVTGHSLGETTLHVETSNGCTTTSLLRVVVPACTSVDFEDTDSLERIGGTHQFHPVVKPARAQTTLSWESSDPAVIEINPETGEARALSPGKATITLWSDNGKKETRKFKVKK